MIYCPPFNGTKVLRIDPVGLSVDVLECSVAELEATYTGVLEDTGVARYYGAVAVDGVVRKGSSTGTRTTYTARTPPSSPYST